MSPSVDNTHSCLFYMESYLYRSLNRSILPVCVIVFLAQASRDPAAGGRLLPQPHAADEGSVCRLLLQPPLCSECAHPVRVCYTPAALIQLVCSHTVFMLQYIREEEAVFSLASGDLFWVSGLTDIDCYSSGGLYLT